MEKMMLKPLLIVLLFVISLFGANVIEKRWRAGETFSDYLIRNGIPLALVGQIRADDIQYLSEIQSGEKFFELRDGDRLLQSLIPIGEEMQIEIIQDLQSKKYKFDIKPIVYKKVKDSVVVEIKRNCYQDLLKLTNNSTLNYILKRMYKKFLDFRYLRVGDKIAFEYIQKSRLGKPWGNPKIAGAVIKTRGKNNFVFIDGEGNFWDSEYKEINSTTIKKSILNGSSGMGFIMPLKKIFITSRFTYKRWHPILKRYRPHLGVDFRGKRGTPIHAINSGKIVYAGWMRGYGKVVKIRHKEGFVSLYAHQSKIKVRLGEYVKRGDIIGLVGNTGRSTGPHLHLGLYKNGKAINPLKVIQKNRAKSKIVIKISKIVKTKRVPIKGAKSLKQRLIRLIKKDESSTVKWDDIGENFTLIDREQKDRYVKQ